MTTPPPPMPPQQPPAPMGGGQDKTLALLSHFGMVIFGFWPALIIYLVKNDDPWTKNEAAKAFNFSIIPGAVLMVVGFGSSVLGYGFSSIGLGCVFCLVDLAAWGVMAVFGIMNGIKVNDGGEAKYPFEIPLLK